VRAIGEKCFIEPDWENEDKSAGGLFLPKVRHRDLPRTGRVISLPSGAKCDFKEGDRVVYDYHKQQLINVPGHPITLAHVKIEDVLAIWA
jgi:co-chaperonin GroES (HSP10)